MVALPNDYMTAQKQPELWAHTAPLPAMLPGVPTTPAAPSGPQFNDIKNILTPSTYNPSSGAGNELFREGLARTAPSTSLRPEIQSALDMIRARQKEDEARAVANAQALSVRRGIGGSSTEQFGTAQATEGVARAARDAETNLLLENARREFELQNTGAKALFDRAGQVDQAGLQQATLDQENKMKLAGFTSGEIASLRNMDFANRQLILEAALGERGLNIAEQNVGVSKDIAKDSAKYGLYGALGQAAVPTLLQSFFGAGGVKRNLISNVLLKQGQRPARS